MNGLRSGFGSVGRGGKLVTLILLSGCASTPVHYHTLVPAPVGDASDSAHSVYRINIAPVRIPAQVDRYELVMRRGDGEIMLADGELWAASLAEELRGAVLIELIRQLGSDEGRASVRPQITLRLDVQRFDSALASYALLEASWQVGLRSATGEQRLTCITRAYQRVRGGYDALVVGQQRNVVALADEIAATVGDMADGAKPLCPVPSP